MNAISDGALWVLRSPLKNVFVTSFNYGLTSLPQFVNIARRHRDPSILTMSHQFHS
jgi:hypothetical protein